ncbi:MAG: hypothetical protein V4667_11000 [Bacteroidota bacterium]
MKIFSRKTIFTILSVVVVILLGLKYLNNGITEYYSQKWVSTTIQDSKAKNAFVRQLTIRPGFLKKDNLEIEFNECWIEQQTRIEYSWLFFKNYIGTGDYNLCFNLKKNYPDMTFVDYFFVHQDGHAFALNGSGNSNVFDHRVDKNLSGQIKISLVTGWKEKRDTSITIDLN